MVLAPLGLGLEAFGRALTKVSGLAVVTHRNHMNSSFDREASQQT